MPSGALGVLAQAAIKAIIIKPDNIMGFMEPPYSKATIIGQNGGRTQPLFSLN
jgi:hypothetical protein